MFQTTSDYDFNQSARLGNDMTDKSQRTLQNSKYLDRSLENHFASDNAGHMKFATKYPGMMVSGLNGGIGLGPHSVEEESELFWKMDSQRPLEKLQLFPRPFATVPYLGRGSCNPDVETQLLHGDTIRGKKSVSTIMENDFMPLDNYPLENEKLDRMNNSKYTVEELALGGWTRGGKSSRITQEQYTNSQSKPKNH